MGIPPGINRNIVECKVVSQLDQYIDLYSVLIET